MYFITAAAVVLSIIDIKEILKNGEKKLIWIYAIYMAAAIGMAAWYTFNHRLSILEVLFNISEKG